MDKADNKKTITAGTVVRAPIRKVWECWTNPVHIAKWAFASDDWEVPYAENDVRAGGRFTIAMAAKDKSEKFDFTGVYTNVKNHRLIEYDMDDGRYAKVEFEELPAGRRGFTEEGVRITETFEPEKINPEDVQRSGWQAMLDNFKKYVELKKK